MCLDNDEAGLNAVDRLCDSTLLTKISEQFTINILIASLPGKLKDPAEFIEEKGGGPKSAKAFHNDVISKAKPWSDWYIDRIISQYDSKVTENGMKGSFSEVCERLSDFLSTFTNAADRTRRSYDVAGKLSDLISRGRSSNALRIQLESDLLDMSSRKARSREALSRRIETIEGSTYGTNNVDIVSKLARGEGMVSTIDEEKMSSKYKREQKSITEQLENSPFTERNYQNDTLTMKAISEQQRNQNDWQRTRKKLQPRRNNQKAPLISHFSGFEFENPDDAVWLGLNADKVS